MLRRLILLSFYAFLFFVCCLSNFSGAAEKSVKSLSLKSQNTEYSNEELPTIMIAYSLFCARYDEFKCLASNQQNVLTRLGENIDSLPGGISTGLAFVHRAFIVENDIKDHVSGYFRIKNSTLKESGGVPYESILFVTTPIESFEKRILVIIGAVSPERTTIFSVNNNLGVELLYDTFKKNYIKNKEEMLSSGSTDSMYSIFNVRVKKPGVFLLEERRDRGSVHPSHPTIKGRQFTIDVTKGIFNLSMKVNKNGKQDSR